MKNIYTSVKISLGVQQVFGYFHIYTVRTEELKDFCNFVEVEHATLLGTSRTRWLSLGPAVERVLKLYPALQSYFRSQDKAPDSILKFLEDQVCEAWLRFIHNQLTLFNDTIKQLEKEKSSAIHSALYLSSLKEKLMERKAALFMGLKVKSLLVGFQERHQVDMFKKGVQNFYDCCISYLQEWGSPFTELKCLSWTLLEHAPEWDEVECSLSSTSCGRSGIRSFGTEERTSEFVMAPAIDRRRVLAAMLLLRRLRRRRQSMWVHPLNQRRPEFGSYHHLVAELQLYPDRHRDYFRMSAEKMEELLSKVGPEIQHQDTNYRLSIEPKQRLAVTIRFLATGESFRSLAFQYRLGKATVANIVHTTVRAIKRCMLSTQFPPMTEGTWKATAEVYMGQCPMSFWVMLHSP
uniref:Uncharacterized protein n=1 Tax=Knipowitschia caucasica TaxID=637954 RepID=A0AAV2L3F0_KNICA